MKTSNNCDVDHTKKEEDAGDIATVGEKNQILKEFPGYYYFSSFSF